MNRKIILILLLVIGTTLFAGKLNLSKRYANLPLKVHPHTQLLNKQPLNPSAAKSRNYEKLLVILVDFQEEIIDDPYTTGNGKFLLEEDPDYLYSIGSPPHDLAYFQKNMEALRYYYLAASHGSYELEYDVYPQDAPAYTLPQTMGYYNPPYADGDLFLSRIEEYFQDSFATADQVSPEIDFSAYGHYMIVHAGSDWQHDVIGDTPSDIPSFFIRAGEGKEVAVDGGAVLISHACNVPSTISQDFRSSTDGDQTIHSGYGALNAVIAHEFGHSLGLVDLYNVYNWQPMVGVFDIMDSGGSGVLVDQLEDGSLVLVEGALPVLPGAWSRTLLFDEALQTSGYLKDVEQIDLFSPLSLAASSFQQDAQKISPQIIRIPLSEKEYILVENRNVDPDGDGGTAVFATEDSRVILYPTPINDPDNNPSYEYDYLLPSFQRADGSAIGGGILVWRINDDVIYDQGMTDSAGNWISNFSNNSINVRYAARGVELIEADNLPDIGYDWSWYWTGTQYEYFHKFKPVLDGNGYFVNWSQDAWKPTLNSTTAPPLVDSHNMGSQYWLSDIANPAARMTFSIRSGFFAETQIETYPELDLLPGPIINSSFGTSDIPLLSEDKIRLLSYVDGEWLDFWGEFLWDGQSIDHPIITTDQNGNGHTELVMVHGNSLELVEFSGDTLQSSFINFVSPINTPPISLNDTLFVANSTGLTSIRNHNAIQFNQIGGILRLGTFDNEIVALSEDILFLVDRATLQIELEVELPEPFGSYEPVSFTASNAGAQMLYIMANGGNIYKFSDEQLELVFLNHSASESTQMGITWYPVGNGAVNPTIFWACGSRIYAMKHDGTLLGGMPFNASPLEFTPQEHVYAIASYPQVYLYLPIAGRGHIAYTIQNGIDWSMSLLTDAEVQSSYLTLMPLDAESANFTWYYANQQGDIYIHSKPVNLLNNTIYWNGFRNDGTGSFEGGDFYDETPLDPEFTAFVYPNPVRNDSYRIRFENFDQDLSINIYDINATLVSSTSIADNGILSRDVIMDSSKLSSGVYIVSIQRGTVRKTLKFAVEK